MHKINVPTNTQISTQNDFSLFRCCFRCHYDCETIQFRTQIRSFVLTPEFRKGDQFFGIIFTFLEMSISVMALGALAESIEF